MIFVFLHILGYSLTALAAGKAVPALNRRRRVRQHHDLLLRITKFESELGLGVYWAKDDLDAFEPWETRPRTPGYSSLHQYAFRCYGCEKVVVYADHNRMPLRDVDKRHLFCDDCLPVGAAA